MANIFKIWRDHRDQRQGQEADKRILGEVQRKFQADKYLSEHDFIIAVTGGVVALEGLVASPLLKNLAEETAASVPGVVEVHNHVELGIGSPGDEAALAELAAGDVEITEGSNIDVPNVNHPTTITTSEVVPVTREDITGEEAPLTREDYLGGVDPTNIGVDVMQPTFPNLDERSSVMDAGDVDAMKVAGTELRDDQLAAVIPEGAEVVDKEGSSLGTVKQIRTTDFLLNVPLARDVYVPYFACRYDGEKVIVDILSNELHDQGWAEPRLM